MPSNKQKNLTRRRQVLKIVVKSEIKNQLEQLLDLFKQTLPPSGGKSLSTISRFFLEAADRTKEQVKGLLVEEIISTIGCSEEQSYEDKLNQPVYIKVNQVDLFKKLIFSPDDEDSKYYYENQPFNIGAVPSSLNRQLYERLQNLGQSLQTQFGTGYQGASGQDLFDIEYVQFYPAVNPTNFGDFFKVTLKPQLNNATNVADFLNDYYNSIDILNFNELYSNVLNLLTGAVSMKLKTGEDDLRKQTQFEKILQRILGLCFDNKQEIDVSGSGKLDPLDQIDDSFFVLSPREMVEVENKVKNILENVIQYRDCGTVSLPVNVDANLSLLDKLLNPDLDAANADRIAQDLLNELAKNPDWKLKIPNSVDLGITINTEFLNLNSQICNY